MESTATTYTYQSTSPIPSIIALILCVIAIVGMWKTFVKAGVPGWHSLIPILNVYDICKISLKENVGLFTVLSVIFPIVLIYPSIQLATTRFSASVTRNTSGRNKCSYNTSKGMPRSKDRGIPFIF